ncbi:molecular chaperone HtpG [Rhodothalassium salexigens]|uniref:molecular chaperone HtpG n=1 Tax=Rhodothalassium salexigens TaxID=1086 RepID=UPI00191182F2|nr:molecular chaperone HtpG [Rhodothalassium salexigens]MBK5911143.1 molecular chaperone HtpG [Rhodothalassium salexigens]
MSDSQTQSSDQSGEERRGFEAEVAKLLRLMVDSVYSEREVFLRELISNAADACDKLRYEAITRPELTRDDPDFAITVEVDKDAATIRVSDNGIGMNRAEMREHLGTIAKSGTEAFAKQLTGDAAKDVSLIGQFGVGFYASFMVADRVRVVSRRAGEDSAQEWESDGHGDYAIRNAERAGRGTDVILHLKDDAREFLDTAKLDDVVRTYSGHIPVPVTIREAGAEDAASVSQGTALWTRSKSDISDEEYTEFYRHVGGGFDEPAWTIHYKAEGMIEYAVLLFVPSMRPMDLFDPARKPRVKLYVRRVYITDDTAELLPGWLRFLRGVIDTEDLPLNISREMLQNNPVVRRMRKAITNKALTELERLADKQPETFAKIWDQFGPVLKEGLYEDADRREQLLKLARFRTTKRDGWVSLADYVTAMKDKQSAIYYVTGEDEAAVARQPQLEGFKARDVEVLLLSDPVDDFWLQVATDFEGKPFKSITRGGSDLKDLGDAPATDDAEAVADDKLDALIARLKAALGDTVTDVRRSDRLTETPACLVADEAGMDMHLERMLKAHQQMAQAMPKVLEINPGHAMVRAMAEAAGKGDAPILEDAAWLLFDQARVLEGETPDDPAAFSRRLSRLITQGLA